jgi:mannose-6-phosphate isomerase-like protein (cupin superfamily)
MDRSSSAETEQVFPLAELRDRRAGSGDLYLEFLRSDSLSAGLYVLEVGADDPQEPHLEDEVYVVMAGRASLIAGANTHQVEPGHVIYVPKHMTHRFIDVTERLELLVIFAPPETEP